MQKNYPLTSRVFFFIPTCLILLAFDQATKIWAIESLKGTFPQSYFFGTVQLIYAENTGAWGNLGGSWSEPYKSIFLIFLPLIVLAAFGFFALCSKKLSRLEFWAYILIFSGGLGNLIDRIRFGHVVDFMYMGIKKPFETNIFNIADVVIMTGFGLICLHLYKDYKDKKKNPEKSNDTV